MVALAESPIFLDRLLNRLCSLGDNCELGLVQREAGAEPIDLLRFASFYLPAEQRLEATTQAIARGFPGLGGGGTLEPGLSEPHEKDGKREYYIQESLYRLRWHTGRYGDEIATAALVAQQAQAVRFWRRKLLESLHTAERMFVWKSNAEQKEQSVRTLLHAMRLHGPNTLLWVAKSDEHNPDGTAEHLGDGLFKGYISRFAPYQHAGDIVFGSWFSLCTKLSKIAPALRAPDAAAVRSPDFDGSIDGLIDGRVCGWCRQKGNQGPVSLELCLDGKRLATFVANVEHEGLAGIGIEDSRHGFCSPVSIRQAAADAVVSVRVLGTSIEIPRSGRRVHEYRRL